jgi:DNA-directed RNA polymerase I, II, and III subunit RPABC2
MADAADFEDNNSGSEIDDDSDVEEEKLTIKIPGSKKKISLDVDEDDESDVDTEDDEEPIGETFDDEEDEDKYVLRTLSEEDETDKTRKQKRNIIGLRDEDDEDDETFEESDDDDDNENYLQKFDESLKTNVLEKHHPELIVHNHQEVEAMCRIVRDETGNIIDPLHKTMPFITKFEKARLLGERAKQINAGAHPTVKVDEDMIDGYLIALKEYDEKKIPMILRRPLPNGGCEYWKLQDLELIV